MMSSARSRARASARACCARSMDAGASWRRRTPTSARAGGTNSRVGLQLRAWGVSPMDRRTFLQLAAGCSLGPISGSLSAMAQAPWPTRGMTIIVPFAPGGQADLAARPVALGLTRILGQSVVVDNRAGAGGAIGAAFVAKADPDGHTILMALSAVAVLPEAERV